MAGRSVSPSGPGATRVEGPDGASVTVEWFRRGRGPFGLDRRVGRDGGATHARITEHDRRGRAVGQWIERDAAVDTRIAAIRRRWATSPAATPPDGTPPDGTPPDGTPPDGTAPPEHLAPPHAGPGPGRPAASRCPHCGVLRVARGEQQFVQRVRVAANLTLDSERLIYAVFACPQCGSVELFESPEPSPSR